MATLEVIKLDFDDEKTLVQKYPNEKIQLGSQLIVNQSQEAVFVNGGRVCDLFGPGTHTLSSANLPILSTLINIPFGGRSPFSAEIWFVRKTIITGIKWGTTNPIVIDDPATGVTMLIRAYGEWAFTIDDSPAFLTQLVGTEKDYDSGKLWNLCFSLVLQNFTVACSKTANVNKVPISQFNAHLDQIADLTSKEIERQLTKYGISLKFFLIQAIDINERELTKIQDTQLNAFALDKLSEKKVSDAYKTVRQFDVLDKAVDKPGTTGDLLAAGMAIGGGLAAGAKAGKLFGDSGSETSPKDDISGRLKMLKDLLDKGLITQEEYDKKRKSILEEI